MSGDPSRIIADRVATVLGPGPAGRVVGSELAAIWFATAAWWRPAPSYGDARRFTYGRGKGAIYGVILGLAVVEVAAVHLLVARWSPAVAWTLSALALYGALYVLGDWRAVRLRPITLDDHTLTIRTGLRWTLEVPRSAVRAARRRDWRETVERGGDTLNLALMGQPDVLVELDHEATARGPFGITRTASRVGLTVDEPDAFLAALGATGEEPGRRADPTRD